MASIVQNAKVYLGSTDLTGQANAVAVNYSANVLDNTVLGNDTKSAAGGVKQFDASIEGYWNSTEDAAVFGNVGGNDVLTVVNGTGIVTDPAFMMACVVGSYNPSGSHGELLAFSAAVQSRSNLGRGQLACNAGLTTSGSQSGVNLGAVSSTQKIVASLHALTVSGTSPTLDVTVESDVDNTFASPTTVLTFSQVTAATALEIEADGPITDTWFRITYTIAGTTPSFAVRAAIGIAL